MNVNHVVGKKMEVVTFRESFVKIFSEIECTIKTDGALSNVWREGSIDPRKNHTIGSIPYLKVEIVEIWVW